MSNKDEFSKKGYTIVRSAISEELCNFITQYALFDEMQDYYGSDEQVPGAHSKYGDPAMETILVQLHEKIQASIGLTLFPTYSYYRVYRPGDDLKTHTDRESCEISCTLCFGYEYENKNYNWPIFMDGNRAELKPGDMVIYRGCDLSHWREIFEGSETDWHVQGFFHYVDANGPNASFKYDTRPALGIVKPKKSCIPQVNKPYIIYT